MYGDEKKKQMARSILPSTRARWARSEQRRINKRNRQKVRKELRRALYDEEYREEGDFYAEPDWDYYVRERQDGDKLNHFMRWAEEVTQDVPRNDRLSKIKAMLPDNLIGWHAISHLKFLDHFATEAEQQIYWWRKPRDLEKEARDNRKSLKDRQERRIRLLREIVERNNMHRLLNQWMVYHHKTNEWHLGYTHRWAIKPPERFDGGVYRRYVVPKTKEVGPTRPRLLKGMGDIEAFLSELSEACQKPPVEVEPYLKRDVRQTQWYWQNPPETIPTYIHETINHYQVNPDRHPEWFQSLESFLRLYEGCRGDYSEVASKVLGR